MNAEGEWWVDGDGAVSGACERREEEVVDEENLYHTTNYASSMCGDGKLDTVEEYGKGYKYLGVKRSSETAQGGLADGVRW